MEKLRRCKRVDDFYSCITEDDELVFFGDADELFKLTNADAMQPSTTGGYALGYRDDEGRIWYGGCDPSNFLNDVSDEYRYPDGKEYWDKITEKTPEIKRLIKKGNCYIWRAGYKPKSIFQKFSKRIDVEDYKKYIP